MFRPTRLADLGWEPLSKEQADAWMRDIRELDEVIDPSPRDPWESFAQGRDRSA